MCTEIRLDISHLRLLSRSSLLGCEIEVRLITTIDVYIPSSLPKTGTPIAVYHIYFAGLLQAYIPRDRFLIRTMSQDLGRSETSGYAGIAIGILLQLLASLRMYRYLVEIARLPKLEYTFYGTNEYDVDMRLKVSMKHGDIACPNEWARADIIKSCYSVVYNFHKIRRQIIISKCRACYCKFYGRRRLLINYDWPIGVSL